MVLAALHAWTGPAGLCRVGCFLGPCDFLESYISVTLKVDHFLLALVAVALAIVLPCLHPSLSHSFTSICQVLFLCAA